MEKLIELYNYYMNERFTDLKRSKKEYDNPDLAIIFEYYSCVQLIKEYGRPFFAYNDIEPDFKEENQLSRYDTGIDACDLLGTIVQSKLRKNNLTWNEVSTFFASQNIFENQHKIRWETMIITRNKDSSLSRNLVEKSDRFIDRPYDMKEMLDYCEKLYENPPKLITENKSITLRHYQVECVELIQNNNKNIIISLPTGTGKARIIFSSFKENYKYLILVPIIILLDQMKEELIKYNPKFKNTIQCIGDGNDVFRQNKNITVCVYNSVGIVEKYCDQFEKIFIDEAHHIKKPIIYCNENDNVESDTEISENDEEINIRKYTTIIRELTKYHNNVYLSATIDKHEGFLYYEKDIRYMIENGYLCDYTIHVPIFQEDPTYKNICEYLIKNYRNIIIYCTTHKEGKYINELFNNIMPDSSYYIDSDTNKTKRNHIIKNYNEGIIPFLINVRVLVEGFNSEITKGICLFNIPNSNISIIQMIGRALRLHPSKTIANIILPFAGMINEEVFGNFINIVANNDIRIKKSYMNKKLGGYINFDKTDFTELDITNDFKFELLYERLGIVRDYILMWCDKLNFVKNYINENLKLPPSCDKNNPNIAYHGRWLGLQKRNHKENKGMFIYQEIKDQWKIFAYEYEIYLFNDVEVWYYNFEMLKKYMKDNDNKILATPGDPDITKLYNFLHSQKQHYKNNDRSMKNIEIYNTWTQYMEQTPQIFDEKAFTWMSNYEECVTYTKDNNKFPKNSQKLKIATWHKKQEIEYLDPYSFLNESKERTELWEKYINDYNYLNISQEWLQKLKDSKKYINDNGKLPIVNIGEFKVLGYFVYSNHRKYKNKKANMTYIVNTHTTNRPMEDIYVPLWEEFINNDKYKKYF